MSIEIITVWYNEQFLAPFFLNHYSWADRIVVLLDSDSTDESHNIAMDFDNTTIVPIKFPDGINEKLKVGFINEAYADIKSDFVIVADADEFVFCSPQDFDNVQWQAARVKLGMVYRHVSELDLDPNKPIREQRRHGIESWPYKKPMIARTGLNLKWLVGNHQISVDGVRQPYYGSREHETIPFRPEPFDGAHWANADPCFAIERRMTNKMRQSMVNLKKKYSLHNHEVTRELLAAEMKKHENDWEIL